MRLGFLPVSEKSDISFRNLWMHSMNIFLVSASNTFMPYKKMGLNSNPSKLIQWNRGWRSGHCFQVRWHTKSDSFQDHKHEGSQEPAECCALRGPLWRTGSVPCEQFPEPAPRPLSCTFLSCIPNCCKCLVTIPPAAFSDLILGWSNRWLQAVAVFWLCHLRISSL